MNERNKGLLVAGGIMLVSVVGLTGCMTGKGGHTYVDGHCITCLNNPITGEALNYDRSNPDYERAQGLKPYENSSARKPEYSESNISFSVTKPVDIVFLRLKKEFGFYTLDERARHFGGPKTDAKKWLAVTNEFRYEALPGVSYHMREYTGHTYRGVNQRQTIDVQLATNGPGTDVAFTYWAPLPKAELAAFGNSIKQRALRALR